ncbi:MAG: universal stress protein [Salinivenus sp.]
MTVNRILFPTDFSTCAEEAFRYASEMAHRFGAALHLLHVVDEPEYDWLADSDAEHRAQAAQVDLVERAQGRLATLATEAASDVETTRAVRSQAAVDEAIVEYAQVEAIDLVVLGTHGRRGVDRLVLGSVADTVLRRAPCPVLTVREGASQAASEAGLLQNVLAPIDFSTASREALIMADEMAGTFGARLHLLFVAEERTVPTFSDTGLPGLGVVKMDPNIVENADAALRHLNERRGGRAPEVAYHVEEGRVASTITGLADTESVDMIVMATRGRQGVDRFLLGSTTERVVRSAPCPVLATRRPDDENDGP